ncbi:MAG: hypothetical protein FJW09_09160 [Actinobacteria bacterium]|nr:hypothetical protein [Actinomycetota bacterium]
MTTVQADRDRGEISTQVVLALPVLILVLVVAVQAALVFHSGAVASAAAARGASVAAGAQNAGLSAAVSGVQVATTTVAELGAELAHTPAVSMADGLVTFTVAVRVPRVALFFPDVVTRVVIEPLERTTMESQR